MNTKINGEGSCEILCDIGAFCAGAGAGAGAANRGLRGPRGMHAH